VFKAARRVGLATGFVSNGNGTPQVLQYVAPWIDVYKVDLKSFDDRQYRKLGEVPYFNPAALRLGRLLWPDPRRDLERVWLVSNK